MQQSDSLAIHSPSATAGFPHQAFGRHSRSCNKMMNDLCFVCAAMSRKRCAEACLQLAVQILPTAIQPGPRATIIAAQEPAVCCVLHFELICGYLLARSPTRGLCAAERFSSPQTPASDSSNFGMRQLHRMLRAASIVCQLCHQWVYSMSLPWRPPGCW